MSPQAKNNFDWVVKSFVLGTCSVVTGVVISIRVDLTTLMVRTEGLDKTMMQHEKRLEVGEDVLKNLSDKMYDLKNCCP